MGRSNEKPHLRSPSGITRVLKPKTKVLKEDNTETVLIGTIADLLEEIKELLFIIRKSKKSKEESISLFRSLLSHYHSLIGIHYRDVISLFIYDTCKNYHRIQLPLHEIRAWWPKK